MAGRTPRLGCLPSAQGQLPRLPLLAVPRTNNPRPLRARDTMRPLGLPEPNP
jgi:hypothetical protein